MAAAYRLFGLETSPFSIKVRSYLRYKKLPFDWVSKTFGTDEEFRSLAKSEALPMLVSPNGGIAHDSTLILSKLEASNTTPSATPTDPACLALATLLEEYADEWLNKAMFHYRWGDAKSAKAAAARQTELVFEGFDVENKADIQKSMAKSMSGRLKTIGLNKKNGAIVEASFERFITLLNAHLEHHLFLFGGHPSTADFALAGQLSQLLLEEKSGNLIREKAPFVTAWCEFMEDPRPGAPFEGFDAVKETLLPLIRDEVATTYVAWCLANEISISKKRKTLAADILEDELKQSVQTHSAAAFEDVKTVFTQTPASEALETFLDEAGLAEVFTIGTNVPEKVEPAAEDSADDAETDEAGESSASEEKSEDGEKPKRRGRGRRRNWRSRSRKDKDGGGEAPKSGGGSDD